MSSTHRRSFVQRHLTPWLCLSLMICSNAASVWAAERDAVKPLIADTLTAERLTHEELAGGEIDRRIMQLIYQNFMVLDLDRDWLNMFKNRTDRGETQNVYYGIGKVLDAGSLFAQFTSDPQVAARTQYIMDQLRSSRDPDGYVGFWNVEPKNHQNIVNWILHEQEYFNLALVRNYRTTGNPQALADARIMADYIMKTFPANDQGEHVIPAGTSIAGITEGFVELYRVTGDQKYLDFAKNLQYEPHWYYLKPYDVWEKNIAQSRYHVYVMLSHMYPDSELYRLIGGEDYLKKSLWMKHELLEKGRGGLLITGSTSEGEHFTYNQQGAGMIEESCVTAYFLRWLDSLMRLDGDMRCGDVMERTIYNALFGAQSPDGRRICYFTPFTGKRSFQGIDTFCCNGNYRRAVAELPQKVFYRTKSGGIALNLYTCAQKRFDVRGTSVEIKQETDYPNSGRVTLTFTCAKPVRFAFRFRTPRWAERVDCAVGQVPCEPAKSQLGYAEIEREWKSGDTLTLSMPMPWRLVRGRMLQDGHVALMRGPVLFTLSDTLNAEALKLVAQPRDLVLDPSSLGSPLADDTVRPGGQKVLAKAWTNAERTGNQVEVVLTEFIDPNGVEVYFQIPEKFDSANIRVVDDELLSEPRRSANGTITSAWYGPKGDGDWKSLFTVKGDVIADLAADYVNPQGQQNLPAQFADLSTSGSWSLFNARYMTPLTDANSLERNQLNSSMKVDGCPLGYAYGLEGGSDLGFFADYLPAENLEENWRVHFSRDMFDRIIPADQRGQYLITHPIADVDRYNVIRWTPGAPFTGKCIAITGKLLSNPGGNGVTVRAINWKDGKTPQDLGVQYLQQANKGSGAIETEFVVHLNAGALGQFVEVAIGNNGSYICDATAVMLRVYAADEPNDILGLDVTEKVQAAVQRQYRTDIGKYSELFGDPAPGKEKSLKLRIQDMGGNIKYVELPDNAPIVWP